MGSRKTRTVTYDPSVKSAKLKTQALSLLSKGQMEANISNRLATKYAYETVDKLDEGLSLLGDYLSDRNQLAKDQKPIYEGFMSETADIGSKYSQRLGSIFDEMKGGYE